MAGIQRAGKNSKVTVGLIPPAGTALRKAEWNLTDRGDDIDTTNFDSGGYEEGIIGVRGCDWDVRGQWDAGRQPFEDPPAVFPRPDLPYLAFWESTILPIQAYVLTLARVLSCRNGAIVRGAVTFDFSGKGQGIFTRPSGQSVAGPGGASA